MYIRSGSRDVSRVFTDLCKRSNGGKFARLWWISEGHIFFQTRPWALYPLLIARSQVRCAPLACKQFRLEVVTTTWRLCPRGGSSYRSCILGLRLYRLQRINEPGIPATKWFLRRRKSISKDRPIINALGLAETMRWGHSLRQYKEEILEA